MIFSKSYWVYDVRKKWLVVPCPKNWWVLTCHAISHSYQFQSTDTTAHPNVFTKYFNPARNVQLSCASPSPKSAPHLLRKEAAYPEAVRITEVTPPVAMQNGSWNVGASGGFSSPGCCGDSKREGDHWDSVTVELCMQGFCAQWRNSWFHNMDIICHKGTAFAHTFIFPSNELTSAEGRNGQPSIHRQGAKDLNDQRPESGSRMCCLSL